jgi:hypothetical protein
MPPESPGSMGLDAPKLPDDDRASGEPPDEPDPDWPDDWPDDDQGDAAQTAPAPDGRGGALPGGGGGGTIQTLVGGRVLAVSGTSITIGGPDHTVTAAVTSSTRITGRVSSIRSVRAGDMVTAQIEQSGGRAVVTAIQDPAQLPPGASSP